jgi:hypothetical protein
MKPCNPPESMQLAHVGAMGWRRRSKSELIISKRASATAASLQVRLRANNRRAGGGGKARNTGARERNLSITITQNQSSTVRETWKGENKRPFFWSYEFSIPRAKGLLFMVKMIPITPTSTIWGQIFVPFRDSRVALARSLTSFTIRLILFRNQRM